MSHSQQRKIVYDFFWHILPAALVQEKKSLSAHILYVLYEATTHYSVPLLLL